MNFIKHIEDMMNKHEEFTLMMIVIIVITGIGVLTLMVGIIQWDFPGALLRGEGIVVFTWIALYVSYKSTPQNLNNKE